MIDTFIRCWPSRAWPCGIGSARRAWTPSRRAGRGDSVPAEHPALIDPIIVGATLHKAFRPRFLADRDR